MRRYLLLFIAIPLISYATNGRESLGLGVEYLFLKPSIDDPYFAVPYRNSNFFQITNGTRFGNLWPYHSGVRITGLFPCTSIDLYGEGFYIKDQQQRTISFANNSGKSTKVAPETLQEIVNSANSTIRYRVWSLKGGCRYWVDMDDLPFLASARFAIQYANFNLREKDLYTSTFLNIPPTASADYSTHSWGIGLDIGFDAGYQIFPCLSLIAKSSFALLAGRLSASSGSQTIDEDFPISPINDAFSSNDKKSIVIPACEMKLGLNYNLPFDCLYANLEIGYDFMYYSGVFDYIRYMDSFSEGLSADLLTPFMAHGLYVSLNTLF